MQGNKNLCVIIALSKGNRKIALDLGEKNKNKNDWSNILGKNYFSHDGVQNYLIYHLLFDKLRLLSAAFTEVTLCKSAGLSTEETKRFDATVRPTLK